MYYLTYIAHQHITSVEKIVCLTITTSLRKLLKGFPSRTRDFRCSIAPIVYGRLIIIYKTYFRLQLLQKLDALCELTINSDMNERRLISKS